MSNQPLDLEDSALLAKLKGQINQLENRVEELEEENAKTKISDDVYSVLEQSAEIVNVSVFDQAIEFDLSDGRCISVPIDWSWKLQRASQSERQNYILSEDQSHVEWPKLNEQISVHGILVGDPAPRPEE